MPVTDSKQESRREIAEGIVNQIAVGAWRFQSPGWVINAIEAALKERDERAAKIAESHRFDQSTHFETCVDLIVRAIRNGDTNAEQE